jgi:hypothetical protein
VPGDSRLRQVLPILIRDVEGEAAICPQQPHYGRRPGVPQRVAGQLRDHQNRPLGNRGRGMISKPVRAQGLAQVRAHLSQLAAGREGPSPQLNGLRRGQ